MNTCPLGLVCCPHLTLTMTLTLTMKHSSEALREAVPETFKDFQAFGIFCSFSLRFWPIVSLLAAISTHSNVLDLTKMINKAPISIIVIAEVGIVVLRGAAGVEEEWANDHTPHPKKKKP